LIKRGLSAVLIVFCIGSIAGYGQTVSPPRAVFNKYCITCHNERLKTAGLLLDKMDPGHVADAPEQWEKVVRKLRTNAMPPAGAPRPDPATYGSVALFLEQELDRAAARNPNAGRLPLLHRLSGTEYQNAVRDLLALEWVPKEMSYSLLLPPDNASSGFDNLADLLFVSPATMERYLDAARKISRLAVGDPAMPVLVNIYGFSEEHPQDAHVEDLPFGTRGGLAIQSDFPLDGEYVFKVELATPVREEQQIEISVDGERMQLVTLSVPPGRGRIATKPLEIRVPVKAGPRLVGVTFVQRTEARNEETVRPRTRGRGIREGLPADLQTALRSVTISGPYNTKGPGDTPSRRRIFVCLPAGDNSADELPCAKRILATLARRAYRRPVTDTDVQRLLPFYAAGRAEAGFDGGIQRSLERLLVSPQFLFRIEREPATIAPGTPYRVSDLELASRLSFFLWSSIPDDELLDVAASGKLKDPSVLEQQTRRMLADPRSESLVTNFAAQWLFLRDIEAKEPDELLFPDFDETLRTALHRETELFLDNVLRENQSVLELLTANYSFLNERLAKHYGVPNVHGSYFRQVTFPEGSMRGGLLGQGSILTLTSYSTRTSPVLRGKWVLENLLSSPPPPPPPNIPALKTEGAEPGKTLSMREAMIQHRANPACASCHAQMDPIGFAMEHFDAIGQWRDTDATNPIDASGVFPDGTKFDGMAGLKKALLTHPEQFVSTVAERLLMYAIGRNLQYYDASAVRAMVRDGAADNYKFSSLVVSVVKSLPFQMRESQIGETKASTTTAGVRPPQLSPAERRPQ
jgi:hypothetical protein